MPLYQTFSLFKVIDMFLFINVRSTGWICGRLKKTVVCLPVLSQSVEAKGVCTSTCPPLVRISLRVGRVCTHVFLPLENKYFSMRGAEWIPPFLDSGLNAGSSSGLCDLAFSTLPDDKQHKI